MNRVLLLLNSHSVTDANVISKYPSRSVGLTVAMGRVGSVIYSTLFIHHTWW